MSSMIMISPIPDRLPCTNVVGDVAFPQIKPTKMNLSLFGRWRMG